MDLLKVSRTGARGQWGCRQNVHVGSSVVVMIAVAWNRFYNRCVTSRHLVTAFDAVSPGLCVLLIKVKVL